MKRIILAAAIAVLLPVMYSGAAVLLHESFSGYANGDLPGQSYQGAGFESGGSWSGAADASTVTNAGSLSYNTLIVSGGKARTRGDGANTEGVPDMSVGGPFDTAGLVEFPGTSSNMIGGGTITGTLYYSVLARSLSAGFYEKYAGFQLYRGGDEGLAVGDNWFALGYSIFEMGGDQNLCNNYGAGDYMMGNTTTRFFVVKMCYSNSTDDSAHVWMDPDLGETEASQGSNVYVNPNPIIGDGGFDNFKLRSGNATYQWEYDEIRFGTTWNDVIPIPEPALALVALCGFAALLRRK